MKIGIVKQLCAKKAHTEIKIPYTLAWILANCGVWVHSGGYHWRNILKTKKYWYASGQYQGYGEYPECIRSCGRHTLKGFKFHSDRGWKIHISTSFYQ